MFLLGFFSGETDLNGQETILVVDDERDVREIVRAALGDSGYGVLEASTGRRMMEIVSESGIDLVLLDLMLTDGNALGLLPSIRAQTQVPVLILSGHGTDRDRVEALDNGADDYIAKPFRPRELCARVRANLRRSGADRFTAAARPGERIRCGRWVLDHAALRVVDEDSDLPVSLTTGEFRILEALAMAGGRVLGRDELAHAARPDRDGQPSFAGGRAVDIHIARIRAKLGMDGEETNIIRAVRGAGYMLDCKTEVIQ